MFQSYLYGIEMPLAYLLTLYVLRFNRTFMELKLQAAVSAYDIYNVSIVPLWN